MAAVTPYYRCEVVGVIAQIMDERKVEWKAKSTTLRLRDVFLDISGAQQLVHSNGGIIRISFYGNKVCDVLERFHVGQTVRVLFEPQCFIGNRGSIGTPKVLTILRGFFICLATSDFYRIDSKLTK